MRSEKRQRGVGCQRKRERQWRVGGECAGNVGERGRNRTMGRWWCGGGDDGGDGGDGDGWRVKKRKGEEGGGDGGDMEESGGETLKGFPYSAEK